MSVSRLPACAVMVTILSMGVHAQGRNEGTLSEVAVPGGIRAALSAVDDRATADRSQFLLEMIRRFHDEPVTKGTGHPPALLSLLAQLDRASESTVAGAARETVPLPLSPEIWTRVVFENRVTPDRLVSAILGSRSASHLYWALLSLDDSTRAWLAERPDLLAHLASEHAASFLVAAPGLRLRNGRMDLPGGAAAEPAWRELVGPRADEPEKFIRSIVGRKEPDLSYFLSAMAHLEAAQLSLALRLDSPDENAPIEAMRRLHGVFERLMGNWNVVDRPFWRPALDPAFLLNHLEVDGNGRPLVPMERSFWTGVFADSDQKVPKRRKAGGSAEGNDLVDFAWVCERIFSGPPIVHRRGYNMALFASRHIGAITPETEQDAIEAVRAVGRFPALTMVLERAGITDAAVFARAARRAARLTAIDDDASAVRALAQFQGALAIITRAAARGSLTPDALSSLVSSLSAVDVNGQGDYEGRLVRWIGDHLVPPIGSASNGGSNGPRPVTADQEDRASAVERALVLLLAGSFGKDPRYVDWEGTRYRLDLATAEATRISRLLGDEWPPSLSPALALVDLADALVQRRGSVEVLRATAEALTTIGDAAGLDEGNGTDPAPDSALNQDALRRYREIAGKLQDGKPSGSEIVSRVGPALRLLADDLAVRGLMELAYAVALGEPGIMLLPVTEIAGRHDFGRARRSAFRDDTAWQLPVTLSIDRGWHVTGSLLGLDVRLAQFSLRRVSSRPPARRPSINDIDRRVFVEAVSLAESAGLGEKVREALVTTLRRGRETLATLRTPADAARAANAIRLGPARRALLTWIVTHDPARLGTFLSLTELLWLGQEQSGPIASFDAWGAPGEPRLGCLCLRFPDKRTWDVVEGRQDSGASASGFPDLNLRLAELLADLHMPPGLLAPVLASATVDFVENATSRYPDDRRGLLEFVQALDRERVEQYLALLTTGGPLVPLGESAVAQGVGTPR